jgi:hypothetical protein
MSESVQDSPAPPGGNVLTTAIPPTRQRVRRRNFFIKKWLQTRYITYYVTIMLFSGLALFTLIQRYAHRALELEMRQGHSAVFDTWSILKPQVVRANLIVVLSVIAVTTLRPVAPMRFHMLGIQ